MTSDGTALARYRRTGRCVRCGRARQEGRLSCTRCLTLSRHHRVKFFQSGPGAQYRREGRCRCGRARDRAGVTCSQCLRGNREQMVRWLASRGNRIRASRRFFEACLTCGDVLAPNSRSKCVRHLKDARQRQRCIRRFRFGSGLCITCATPREDVMLSTCETCRARARAADRARGRARAAIGRAAA